MNTASTTILAALIAQLEAASEGDRALDADIARWFSHHHYEWWRERPGPSDFTTSLDAALTLVPNGRWFQMGAGKTREDEPLYGAVIYMPNYQAPEAIAAGEHPASLPLALCIAALKARLP